MAKHLFTEKENFKHIMKKITTLLLTILMLSCFAQEPDTLVYHKTNVVDSLTRKLNQNLTILDSLNRVIDSLEKYQISTNMVLKVDTINIDIIGNNTSVNIDKKGSEIILKTRDGINIFDVP